MKEMPTAILSVALSSKDAKALYDFVDQAIREAVAEERERCAKLVDYLIATRGSLQESSDNEIEKIIGEAVNDQFTMVAKAIRERKE